MNKYVQLEAEAPEGWFSQYDMRVLMAEVSKLKSGQIYAELGTYKGRSLWCARKASNSGVRIIGIDLLEDPAIPNTEFLNEDTARASVKFVDGSIDLLFIDGDHSYGGCRADILCWTDKMAEGSVMLFHDCDETSPGVVRAVNEFASRFGYQVELFKKPGNNTSIAKIQL
jgi:predicted O-methyltransferase YrrM